MTKHSWALAFASLFLHSPALDSPAATGTRSQAIHHYAIRVWDTDDGLPQNSVTSIMQTRDGYLWFGTLNGLVRFDGMQFTVFDQSNVPDLGSSRIVHLFEDSLGNLWVGTETAGVALIQQGKVTNLPIGHGTREGRLQAACEDSHHAVWLYTGNGQLWRYANGRFGFSLFEADRPSSCRTVITEPAGPVWVGADARLSALDPIPAAASIEPPVAFDAPVQKLDLLLASPRHGYWRLADGRVQKWSANHLERDWGPYKWRRDVSAACEDSQGNLVVGTLGEGIFWFDADGAVTALSTNDGLSHNYILSLCLDREGSLWVGTDGGGLNRVKQRVFEVPEWSRSSAVNVVQSVCEDAHHGLWIGSNGGGAWYWKEGALERFGPDQGLMNLSVWTVFVDRDERVWAGTRGGGLYQFQNGRFQRVSSAQAVPPDILAIHQDRHGQLWLGTETGLARLDERGWRLFTTSDGLSANTVRAIADDPRGTLWIGTIGGGLNRFVDGKFTRFTGEPELPSKDITSLHADSEGVLWIGTDGGGLVSLQNGKCAIYTKSDGLVSNSVRYLLEDNQGHLWIGSNAGLARIQKRALHDFARGLISFLPCRAYGKPDGLPTGECSMGSQPAACRTRDGRLWFPTIKGLAAVYPDQLFPNPHPPPVMIESVLIDGQPQATNTLRAPPPPAVTVPAGKEHLEIHYTSLNLAAPDRASFQYRLEGHETAWTKAGNSRVARYSKLPPGRYRFQVRASNEDGVLNETGSILEIAVTPPLWKTWWFLSASGACLLGTIIAVVHYLSTQKLQAQLQRLKHQEALEHERTRIARDIHDQLGASLTHVSLLSELVLSDSNHPEEVQAHARLISHTARDTTRVLDEIVWAVNPANDTLDGLVTYVSKYAQEYLSVAGLRCRLDVPADLPPVLMPPEVRHNVFLAFKEAITNVVKHAGASSVWVNLRLEPPTFILEVQDNGRGLARLDQKVADARNGLRNMRRRMEEIGGTFSLGPAPQGGAQVRLTAPLRNLRPAA
jgi:ligand-binding sensor domain-containing protein/signal transduction histidine kinase